MKTLKSNTKKAKTACTIIWILFGINLFYIFSLIMYLVLFPTFAGESEAIFLKTGIEELQLKIAFFNFIFWVISIVTFLGWYRKAYANLHILTGNNLSYTKNWAVWAWFVPILNLVRPYLITKEMFIETEKIVGKADINSIRKITIWWSFLISTFFIGCIGIALFIIYEDNHLYTTIVDLIVGIAFIPNYFLTINLIKNYSGLEKQLESTIKIQQGR